MARQNKNLSNAFDRFSNNKNETKTVTPVHEQSQEKVIEQQNQDTEQSYVISNSNNNDVTKHVIQNSNTNNISEDVTQSRNTETTTEYEIKNDNNNAEQEDETLKSNTTIEDVKQNLLSMYEKKTKKETVEDTHTRTTFLFRKDLAKRLDKIAKNKRGFKTMFMNKAIEALLDEMEKIIACDFWK